MNTRKSTAHVVCVEVERHRAEKRVSDGQKGKSTRARFSSLAPVDGGPSPVQKRILSMQPEPSCGAANQPSMELGWFPTGVFVSILINVVESRKRLPPAGQPPEAAPEAAKLWRWQKGKEVQHSSVRPTLLHQGRLE